MAEHHLTHGDPSVKDLTIKDLTAELAANPHAGRPPTRLPRTDRRLLRQHRLRHGATAHHRRRARGPLLDHPPRPGRRRTTRRRTRHDHDRPARSRARSSASRGSPRRTSASSMPPRWNTAAPSKSTPPVCEASAPTIPSSATSSTVASPPCSSRGCTQLGCSSSISTDPAMRARVVLVHADPGDGRGRGDGRRPCRHGHDLADDARRTRHAAARPVRHALGARHRGDPDLVQRDRAGSAGRPHRARRRRRQRGALRTGARRPDRRARPVREGLATRRAVRRRRVDHRRRARPRSAATGDRSCRRRQPGRPVGAAARRCPKPRRDPLRRPDRRALADTAAQGDRRPRRRVVDRPGRPAARRPRRTHRAPRRRSLRWSAVRRS